MTRLDLPAAQALFRQATADPTDGRVEAAEKVLRGMLDGGVHGPDLHYMLGYAVLAQGRYEEGFRHYQARRNIPAFGIALPPFPNPRWAGESLVGKRLLVWPEQGFGDQIMFSRFALALARAGASITLAVPRPLVRLFEGTPVAIRATDQSMEVAGYDYVALAGDLPGLCHATVEALPPPWPIKGTPGAPRGRIGVVASGDPKHPNDANRSLPPDLAARLLALPGAISLRPEDTGAQDFQATADLIAGLDLVISVDTATAHLAASMGKPTWILIPHQRTDWRWLRDRKDSPWYPSARLWRQNRPDDWTDVIEAILQAV